MFESPQRQPTMWERAGQAMFGFVGRAVRIAGGALWRHPARRPILLVAGSAQAAVGFWKALHEPFNSRYIEGDASPGWFLWVSGCLLLMLGIRKSDAPKN